ncbi:hypothetical protein M752DRAFT_18353 [Aspergillus phoenicis ATCC 13157]|uniref:Uncharacterized protein n=1 Tax=Aspergillus phoenicis ATCC 13157 TaxID=1353007 RepID=A0A370PK93_ASPPH|nr:hypothetical protein M752DRAFT_18353 [Aspergillus phoenicis ATCC 13157]
MCGESHPQAGSILLIVWGTLILSWWLAIEARREQKKDCWMALEGRIGFLDWDCLCLHVLSRTEDRRGESAQTQTQISSSYRAGWLFK